MAVVSCVLAFKMIFGRLYHCFFKNLGLRTGSTWPKLIQIQSDPDPLQCHALILFKLISIQDLCKKIPLISLSHFPGLSVEWVGETGLAGNLWKEDMDRLNFVAESNAIFPPADAKTTERASEDWVVSLKPMEIRTFVIKVVYN